MKRLLSIALMFLAAKAGAFTVQGNLVVMSSATVANQLTATSVSTYSVVSSSGILVQNGPVVAPYFYGNGAGITNVQASALAHIIDVNSPVVTTSMTVQGNAFSVGGSSLVVTGGKVGIGTTNPAVLFAASSTANTQMISVHSGMVAGFQACEDGANGKCASLINGNDTHGTASLGFSTDELSAQTRVLSYTSDGKVGIGTTTPAYTQDVAGSERVTGQLIVGGSVTIPSGSITTITGSSVTFISTVGVIGGVTIIRGGSFPNFPVMVSSQDFFSQSAATVTLAAGLQSWEAEGSSIPWRLHIDCNLASGALVYYFNGFPAGGGGSYGYIFNAGQFSTGPNTVVSTQSANYVQCIQLSPNVSALSYSGDIDFGTPEGLNAAGGTYALSGEVVASRFTTSNGAYFAQGGGMYTKGDTQTGLASINLATTSRSCNSTAAAGKPNESATMACHLELWRKGPGHRNN